MKLKKIRNWFKKKIATITPGKTAIKGASIALIFASAILFVIFAIDNTLEMGDPWLLLFFLTYLLVIVLAVYLTLWVLKKVYTLSRKLKLALLISIPLFLMALSFEGFYMIWAVIVFALLGAAINLFISGRFKKISLTKKIVTVTGLLIALFGLIGAIIAYTPVGFDMEPVVNAASLNADAIANIHAESPATKGNYTVKTLTYGSGKDKHRPEFGAEVTIQTDSVNGNPFLDNWEGFSGWYREKFWGFDAKSLAVNGYVWYPEGEGPFPLALIVHGNHGMQDFSDTGYGYLGELMASRGIIFASVDENFLNSSWSDIAGGLEEENDARGWMLLEHLRVWQEWNADEKSIFYKKIDTTNLALLGHSRGGEAVGHAALLNRMPRYMDDATIPLDYNFNIQSIVAIAPVDGQYEPGDARTEIEDINYFVFHGSQDGDVNSYSGSKQYERVQFSDSTNYFKTGLYIQGANHGQFNTSWGDNDVGLAATKFLNLKQLLAAEDQRKIAEVYISAFLEATLKNNKTYLPLFSDARKGKDWLPETIYFNQFQDSSFESVASFDEDFDVSTTSADLGRIYSENLSVWREQEIKLKWGEKGSRAVYVGWHYDLEDEEDPKEEKDKTLKIPDSILASYSVDLPYEKMAIDSSSVLTFTMAESTEKTNPKESGKWVDDDDDEDEDDANSEDNAAEENANGNTQDAKDEEEEENPINEEEESDVEDPIDFTIVLRDANGHEASLPLSHFSALQRELEVRVWKADFISGDSSSENIFQTFQFPLIDFQESEGDFDLNYLLNISFVFDKTPKGVIVIDDIGFMKSQTNKP